MEAIATAASLMAAFAERTGLTSDRAPRRYLWTDAFAVCNFLALADRARETRYLDLALRLVDQVHDVLGRHRPDDARRGWLSGLDEATGAAHPTRGGLRIGKPLPERRADEPFDERLEWERDGQYFHYLTKWMHALDQVAGATGDRRYNVWARELAAAAHAAFTRETGPGGRRRMVWKTSVDLARTLVPSMGHHDPLDGLVTCLQLEATAARLGGSAAGPGLAAATEDFARMLAGADLRTTDPLGLGGLLVDVCRLAQLDARGAAAARGLAGELIAAAEEGIAIYARRGEWQQPAAYRLAFRELGLAIGLGGVALLRGAGAAPVDRALRARLSALASQAALGETLVAFWRNPVHQRARTWSEHLDINEVMLATALVPAGFLGFGDVA
jgi:hypothetical protein